MDTGKALEIVHAMATSLYNDHGEFCGPAITPAEVKEALDTVEDFIVNNFDDDDDMLPNDYVANVLPLVFDIKDDNG